MARRAMMRICCAVFALALGLSGLFACGAPRKDLASALFDPSVLLEIEIQMADADWEFVRQQKRANIIANLFGPACLSQPWDDPYVYKPAKVAINGQVFESVGVRKKGFVGSVNPTKPSLHLKFDKFVTGQTLLGLERLTLNNNTQDNAFLSQCLAHDLFRKAGIPASRCQFAVVRVNGKMLGLYSSLESIDKHFLRRHFDDDDGDLYEGTFSDFRNDWMATWEAKTSSTRADLSNIKAIRDILALPDSQAMEALDKQIDLARFYAHWALEGILNHTDGYANSSNNFFVYRPKKGKMVFFAWGMDRTFVFSLGGQKPDRVEGIFARSALTNRIYRISEGRAAFLTVVKRLLRDVWDETAILAEIDRMEALIKEHAEHDPFLATQSLEGAKGNGDFASAIQELRDFVKGRRAAMDEALAHLPDATPPLQSRLCEK